MAKPRWLNGWVQIGLTVALVAAGVVAAWAELDESVENLEKKVTEIAGRPTVDLTEERQHSQIDKKAEAALRVAEKAVEAATQNTKAIKENGKAINENRKAADQDRKSIVKELHVVGEKVAELVGEVHSSNNRRPHRNPE